MLLSCRALVTWSGGPCQGGSSGDCVQSPTGDATELSRPSGVEVSGAI